MVVIDSYSTAVVMCVVTMLCWGSWANTQKLASKEWKFQLFYWDYAIGVLLFALILAFTMGSTGEHGRGFMEDMSQASSTAIWSAIIGGIVFNLANILLVAAIDIAGMSVAFPVGIGLALVLGVITTYDPQSGADINLLVAGVISITLAMVLAAWSYKKLSTNTSGVSSKGLILSVIAGALMGRFYKFVVDAMAVMTENPQTGIYELSLGQMSPYTAMVFFAVGLLLSSFVWNTIVMYKPFSGKPVSYKDYIKIGTPKLHMIGILGGAIWCLGMSFNIIASGTAGAAIAYGLGQGATLIAAIWGVFIWKEFKDAPAGTNKFLIMMFICYLLGIGLIIKAGM